MAGPAVPAALLLLIACAGPALAAPPAPKDPFALKVERYILPNGLTVVLHPEPALPQVVVSLWFNVGSKDERPGRTGFAHLYEHLMFMGSKYVPQGAYDQIMEAEGGMNNASTSNDATHYFEVGPAQLLPTFLWLESERLTTLPLAMTDEKVGLQREVVRNERRQRLENQPYGQAELRMPAALFPKGHPYSWPVIGSHADLLAASTEDVKQFFYRYYVPSNATLMIAGDFNPTEARRLVEHYFGWMPKQAKPAAPTAAPIAKPQVGTLALEDAQAELPRVYLVWHAPPAGTMDVAETDLLAAALGLGKGSRLYQDLVVKRHLAQEVSADVQRQALGSLLTITVTGQKGVKVTDLAAAAEADVAALAQQPPRPEEVERARNQLLTALARQIEPLVSRVYILQAENAYYGDPAALAREVAHVQKLGPQEVLARARALGLADPSRRLVVTVVPNPKAKAPSEDAQAAQPAGKKTATAAAAPEVTPPIDLSKRPTAPPGRPFAPPPAARFKVKGLDVVLVQRKGAALLAAQVVIPAGSSADGPAQAGLASAVASMLTEGAGERGATQLAGDLERLGATIRAQAMPDATYVALDVLPDHYREAAPLLYDVVARPKMEAKEWQRVKAERIAEVVRHRSEAEFVADQAFRASVYGEDHPYGTPPLGTEATLARLTDEDLRRFHAERYAPAPAILVVAGDLALTQAQANEVAAAFTGWTGGKMQALSSRMPAPRPVEPRLVLVDRPGSPQSEVRIGRLGQSWHSPDLGAADVANVVLGGSFTSRLNQDLREKHGWTYGAGTHFMRQADAGVFLARAAVRADATAPAVAATRADFAGMLTTPPDKAELDKGRRTWVQYLMGVCEQTPELAHLEAELVGFHLPLNEMERLITAVKTATPDAVRKVAKAYFEPDQATVVVVGDLKKVEAPLQALKLPGQVERRDLDGKLIRPK